MIRTISSLLLVFVLLPNLGMADEPAWDPASLAGADARAYHRLANADAFTSAHVDVFGMVSPEALAFSLLIRNDNADEIFSSLLASDRLPARMFGLAGLYYNDYSSFLDEVCTLKDSTEVLPTHLGCIVGKSTVSELIRQQELAAYGLSIVQLPPGEFEKLMENYGPSTKGSK